MRPLHTEHRGVWNRNVPLESAYTAKERADEVGVEVGHVEPLRCLAVRVGAWPSISRQASRWAATVLGLACRWPMTRSVK